MAEPAASLAAPRVFSALGLVAVLALPAWAGCGAITCYLCSESST